jgi:carboxyl-terminal processing protease
VAIITITSFGDDLDQKMAEKTATIKANSEVDKIIIDVRSNSGGLLNETIEVASYFITENQVVLKEKTKDSEEVLRTKAKEDNLQEYDVIVLVDRFSASASEILAGALRDQRKSKLVGQTTFGKGTVQQLFPLENGDKLKLTIAEWFTPSGSVINKEGLEPDITINENEDTLEKALEMIQNGEL